MGIKAFKQLEAASVTENLLSAAVQTKLAAIATNTSDIQSINDSVGAANGIAALGADGKVPTSQLPAVALSEFKGEVADEAAMVALTAEMGDWAYRADTQSTYILSGSDATVAANWRVISTPDDGVLALANSSGSITGQTGNVTLADVAFSGAAADVSGLSDIATSGSSNDASYDGSATNYLTDASNTAAALTALDTQIKANADAITTAQGTAVATATLINGTVTGAQDDSNNTFTVSGVDTAKKVMFFRDGIEQLSAGFATLSGSTITTTVSAPASDESLVVVGYPN